MKPLLFGLCLLALPVQAQESDRDFLTGFLEDNLSSAGRQVVVTGFEGALSSQATIAQLTIADEQGIWLTLNGLVLDWNRSALLGGRVSVNRLTADEILLDRWPMGPSAPNPESGSFAIPELPVSVELGEIGTPRVMLGPDILGSRIEGSILASMTIDGGTGAVRLELQRTDNGPQSAINLAASYDNATEELALNLTAVEAAGGIASELLNLPGRPSTELAINGKGPLAEFTAEIRLASDNQPRLQGQVTLAKAPDGQGFKAQLQGDLAPLFLPEYADFFGSDLSFMAEGTARTTGGLALRQIDLRARSVQIAGQADLAADGLPSTFDLKLALADPDGGTVTLPFGGEDPVRLGLADLTLGYDARNDAGWRLDGLIHGLATGSFGLDDLQLSGSGRIGRTGGKPVLGGNLDFSLAGATSPDPRTQAILRGGLSGRALFHWQDGQPLSFSRLALSGPDYDLTGSLSLSDLSKGLFLKGKAKVATGNLARFSALSGLAMQGSLQTDAVGQGHLLAGDFALTGTATTQNLVLGQPELDSLLGKTTRFDFDLNRDLSGLRLDRLEFQAGDLLARVKGSVARSATRVNAEVSLGDLTALGSGYKGAVSARLEALGPLDDLSVSVNGSGRNLGMGLAEIDRLLVGESRVAVSLAVQKGQITLQEASLGNPQLRAEAKTVADGLGVTARLSDLGLILPEFPGPVTINGTARNAQESWSVNLSGQGPGGINAKVSGAAWPRTDLRLTGDGQAALANVFVRPRTISGPVRFDLVMKGAPSVQNLSGTIGLAQGRLADPALPFSLAGLQADARINAGRAELAFQASVSSGGNVQGRGVVGLATPFVSQLQMTLSQVTLRDPRLYQTRLNGSLGVDGPLANGARVTGDVLLNETEVRIPDTGFGAAGSLPDLQHADEPPEVRLTRQRAGLLGTVAEGAGQSQRPVALDLSIRAPERLFVRGRGLDAELGGTLRLTGTSENIQPIGQFSLIRGRLDILGKRLTLAKASLQLEGDFDPLLDVLASTESEGITASVRIAGRAFSPVVTFESVPDLPDEEVLARLLFGQDLTSLSAFQLAQLAGAVASLAGKGGEGLVAKLRQGLGLDDLDVSTGEDGSTAVKLGKYISRNAYTTVEVDSTGSSEIQLNLDVTDSLTARGSVDNKGDTGLGLFLEKDY